MKKALSVLLALVLVVCVAPLREFSAGALQSGDYTYYLSGTAPNQVAVIQKYTGLSATVVVPDTLGGCPVKHITDEAFRGCTSITALTLPPALITVGLNAFRGCTGLTGIAFPPTATTIGDNAFYGCTGLLSVDFGTGIKKIGNDAFSKCTGLTEITLPDNVTSIGTNVFNGCTGLYRVIIGDGLATVNTQAFYDCTGITSVTIGKSVTLISLTAFKNCTGLQEIIVHPENTAYSTIDNGCVLYNKEKTVLKQYLVNKTAAFAIPAGVTEIGTKAFENWTRLTGITMPAGLSLIGVSAFAGCTGLTGLTIGTDVVTIGESAFSGCKGLTSLTLSDAVATIGKSAFSGCTGLPSLVIPNQVKTIGDSAFSGCSKIASVTFGSGVESIGASAFSGCKALTGLTIPDNVKSVGASAFNGCSVLAGAVVGDGVAAVPSRMFGDCTMLASVVIGSGALSIDFNAFAGVASLSVLTVDADNPNYSSRDCVLFNKDQTTLIHYLYCFPKDYVIPGTVTAIGEGAFYGFKLLSSVVIPAGVESIGASAFYGCTGLTGITVPAGVKKIDTKTFYGCTGLTAVSLPAGLESIEAEAFSGCAKLVSVPLPSTLVAIKTSAFLNCAAMTSLVMPNSVSTLGASAYSGCKGLTSASLSNILTTIPDSAFIKCTGLASLTIPDSVTNIGPNAFNGCTGLTALKISAGVTNIGVSAFAGCTKLASLRIPNSTTIIGESAFAGCTAVGRIVLGSELTDIGVNAFKGCTGITAVAVPNNVSTIRSTAFQNCSKLATAYFYGNAPLMGTGVFSGCAAGFKVRYVSSASGFSALWSGYPAEVFTPLKNIVITPSTSAPTNANVSVAIEYLYDSDLREYKIDNGIWTAYTVPLDIAANCTVWARCTDLFGNITSTVSLAIGNIDKTAPAKPVLSANPTAPTSGSVTVTVTYPADAAVKEYKIGAGAWTPYTAAVALTANNTVYARCKDAAGNLSETASITVGNISNAPPAAPVLAANPTAPTNGSVTVTVTYPAGVTTKEYRVGTGAWTPYTAAVVLTANNTVYARCSNSSGVFSEISTLVVGNIDKTPPTAPTLSKDPETATGGNVTVTVAYPADAVVKQAKTGSGGVWAAYTGPLVLTANATVYAKCFDAAGNASAEASIVVGNIDKTPPGIPSLPKAASASYSSVKITWNAAALATGYVVYRLNTSTGAYTRVKVTKALSYIDGSLTTGKTYTYKVRAYRTVGAVNVYGEPSAAFSAKPIPATPANVKAVRYSATSIKLTWSPVAGASGYVVYKYNASTKTYARLKVLSSSAASYINTGLAKGVTYYYKVRAYRTVNGVNVYGNPSGAVSAKTY